jgi:hypothetical protein
MRRQKHLFLKKNRNMEEEIVKTEQKGDVVLKEEITVSIGKNFYTIKVPTVRQLLALEKRKANIVVDTTYVSGLMASNIAKAIVTFETLIPSLKEDMNLMSFEDMSLKESKMLVEPYIKVFVPWFNDWMNTMSDIFMNE